MKIPASIRLAYDNQLETNKRLRDYVDGRFTAIKDRRSHYESRLKEPQSFALKIESGRCADPASLEDFFACTLVVANASEVDAAETLVRKNFEFVRRRPDNPSRTHKKPSDFPFDDLRLYVRVGESEHVPRKDFADVVFEIQIKTFLQHAWSIATHDLVYKTEDVDWSKERIAYQVKAMLEHAEVSIIEAESLAQCGILGKEDRKTDQLKSGIALLKAQWKDDELPRDVRRLAQNVTELLSSLGLDLARLEAVLNQGKAQRAGQHPSNLSPYATVVQYLLIHERDKMLSFLTNDRGRTKILIPREVDLPNGVAHPQLRNAVFV